MLNITTPRGPTWQKQRCDAFATLQRGEMMLYAVRTPDGLIKIGASRNLAERFRHVKHEEILGFKFASRAEELAIHRALAAHAHHGREWYHPTPEVLAVVNDMRDHFGLPHLAA